MRFVICSPLLEGGAPVLTADRNCVRLSPPDEETLMLRWDEIDRVYLSRQIPRKVYLVFLTKAGLRHRLLIGRLPGGVRRLPLLCRFGLAEEGKPLHRLGLEPVAAHLNDGRIISELLSVRVDEP